jgi:class 3 adenylate cyclase
VESAVSIRRTLTAHRKDQGFAPWVRIGLHAAEATRVGANYRGKAIHVAARVAALAERDEILISQDTLQAAEALPFSVFEPRTVWLKGIKESVEVVSVSWQPSAT